DDINCQEFKCDIQIDKLSSISWKIPKFPDKEYENGGHIEDQLSDNDHCLPFKVLGTSYNSDLQRALDKAYSYLEEYNRPVFVKLEAEPENIVDRNAIAVNVMSSGDYKILCYSVFLANQRCPRPYDAIDFSRKLFNRYFLNLLHAPMTLTLLITITRRLKNAENGISPLDHNVFGVPAGGIIGCLMFFSKRIFLRMLIAQMEDCEVSLHTVVMAGEFTRIMIYYEFWSPSFGSMEAEYMNPQDKNLTKSLFNFPTKLQRPGPAHAELIQSPTIQRTPVVCRPGNYGTSRTIHKLKQFKAISEYGGNGYQCDVLAGERGPSYTNVNQIKNWKLIHIRVDKLASEMKEIASSELYDE
ncbi:Hypothetical predicted protein, partial [Paramuricea clavata]